MHREYIRKIGSRLIGSVQLAEYWQGRLSGVSVIMNPAAGLLSRHGQVRERLTELVRVGAPCGDVADSAGRAELLLTEYPGHGRALGREIGASAAGPSAAGAAAGDVPRLVVSVGGDGTHEEVLSGLLDSGCDPRLLRVLRIPMGSGNDAADVASLADALPVLRGEADGSAIPAVLVRLAGGERLYAFNIASFGLDACVVAWSNRLKRKRFFPGDSYKLAADLVSLFYTPSFRRGPMRVLLQGPDGEDSIQEGLIVLLAIGAGGHRVYGSGKRVLPGEENMCLIRNMGLRARIALKDLFYRGEHVNHPQATMARLRSAVIDFGSPLYFQADGESRLLQAADFPVRVDVYESVIPRLTAHLSSDD